MSRNSRVFTTVEIKTAGENLRTVSTTAAEQRKRKKSNNKKIHTMEKIQIKSLSGSVIFEHEAENNSIKITVEEAVKKNVCLALADLGGVNLAGANLRGAILRGANLRDTNLKVARLAWADLERADLERADLKFAFLNGADLDEAGLEEADLNGAYLDRASLIGANLKSAYLDNADLHRANFGSADLSGAKLKCAKLFSANLEGANLEGADLKGTELLMANLFGAKLQRANLEGSFINGANLNGADLNGAKNIPFIPLSCPSEGAFIGWKKVEGKYLIKIQIPEDAKRLSATTRKCRCDKALVLDITSLDGKKHYDEVTNTNYNKTVYKAGEMVYPDSFDEDRWIECSHGIHFFVNKEDAINY